jgi:RimJ/RimL family protein N-acetyltransferase
MTAARPPRTPLIGDFVRLDPLLKTDIPDLFTAIGHPVVFAGGFGGGPTGYTDNVADFTAFAEGYFDWERGNVHAVRLVGFDLDLEHAHIGWTAYDPRVWGTAVNAEAKLLLLGAAFDNGFGRVKLQADVLNERSRAAIAKLGAQFEGIVRRDRRRADGSWRDSAIFSVVVDEWPEVRAGLEARLAAYGAEPVRLRAVNA